MGGIALMLGTISLTRENAGHFPIWWNICGLIVVALIAVLAAVGHRATIRTQRIAWSVVPILTIVLQLVSFSGLSAEEFSQDPYPWVWFLEPIAICLLVLVVPSGPAFLLALFSAISPMVSALMFHGAVPAAVAEATPIHLGNLVFVVLISAARLRFDRLRAARDEERAARMRRARAEVDKERHAEFSRLVHDEVLSVLSAAMLFRGDPPEILREEARSALSTLSASPNPSGPGSADLRAQMIFSSEAAERMVRRLQPIIPSAVFTQTCVLGMVPMAVVDEVTMAAGEALRNSRRHAGPGAMRSVTVSVGQSTLTVTVADTGRGFDLATMRSGRMGVTQSILTRMTQTGGRATITTAPGAGTEVVLQWPVP